MTPVTAISPWMLAAVAALAICCFKLGELILKRGFLKTAEAVDAVGPMQAVVKKLQEAVDRLEGIANRVNEHDWKIGGLRADVDALKAKEEMHARDREDIRTKLAGIELTLKNFEKTQDGERADLKALVVKVDALADRVQSMAFGAKGSLGG